jgi:hypothetical protein
MEKVVMIFPDNLTLSQFLEGRNLSHAEVYSRHHSIVAPLSEKEIEVARKDFNGIQISFHYYQKSFK